MNAISEKDRAVLRGLACRRQVLAGSLENRAILKKWEHLAEGRRVAPTVRLLVSNFSRELLAPRMECEGGLARELEFTLLHGLSGRELFDDDTPISGTFDVAWRTWVKPFGAEAKTTPSKKGMGFHIDPVIQDLEGEFGMLRGGGFGVDREGTLRRAEAAEDAFGDILPVRMVMGSLPGPMTNPLVHLMGMEDYYCAMYDCPDKVHEAMDMACSVYEGYYDFLEAEGLLLPTAGTSPLSQESFAFNSELPADSVTKTTECWGFLESQETTAVSPDAFGEFVFPYQDRLVKRFGLLSYGCCERVDAIFPGYLSKWEKLRKLSVSPFNDEEQVGEYLRGTSIVYYSKPRAEFLTNPGLLDEEGIRQCFKGIAQASRGCVLEVAQREAGTIFGDAERGRRYVRLAKEAIEAHWQP